jgi:hypothetical protein
MLPVTPTYLFFLYIYAPFRGENAARRNLKKKGALTSSVPPVSSAKSRSQASSSGSVTGGTITTGPSSGGGAWDILLIMKIKESLRKWGHLSHYENKLVTFAFGGDELYQRSF